MAFMNCRTTMRHFHNTGKHEQDTDKAENWQPSITQQTGRSLR